EMAVEFGHEGLAKAHDLAIRAAAGVEVGAALAAADRHAREGVLEDLLESEELDDAEVHRRMEAEAALVGSQSRVELHAEAAVDLNLAGVVDPRDPEDDLPLRLADPLDQGIVRIIGMLGDHPAQALQHLVNGLVELSLARIAAQDLGKDGF